MHLVLCNAPPADAQLLARTLVEERLAACVNIMSGVESVYRWAGEVVIETEATLLVKTSDGAVIALTERLRALHPYDVPEILVFSPDSGRSLEAYVSWVKAECDAV